MERKILKRSSPLQTKRAERELNNAIRVLNGECVRIWNVRNLYQTLCGGWVEALSNPYDLNIPHYAPLKASCEIISRHVRLLGPNTGGEK
jgi:hypothetical protein